MKSGECEPIGGVFISTKVPTAHVAKLKKLIELSLDDNKAVNIITVSLTGKSSLADYMIVASGTSQRHLISLANHIEKKLRAFGVNYLSVQGKNSEGWVLVDSGDIIVHLFKPDIRENYNLEKMWGFDQSTTTRAKKKAK